MELLEQDFLPTIFSKMFSWTLQMDTESIDSVQLYAGLKVKAVQVNWVFYQQTQRAVKVTQVKKRTKFNLSKNTDKDDT
jgi:hypothetical protein